MPVGRSDGCRSTTRCHETCAMVKTRPDQRTVVRTRGRFRARRSPRPRKTDCAEGRSIPTLYRSHRGENRSQSDRPTPCRAQRGKKFVGNVASQLLCPRYLRSWGCNLSQALSAVFLYSSIKSGMVQFELFGALISAHSIN